MLRSLAACLAVPLSLAVAAPLAAAPRASARPGGLGGLGAPGLGLGAVDPKAAALEADLLKLINAARARAGVAALDMDEKVRAFSRREAEGAARNGVDVRATDERLAQQRLAAEAHRLQFAYGVSAGRIMADLSLDEALEAAFVADYDRAGIGAFWVPVEKPFFQVLVVLVRDPDPMAGKPGLSPAQTDPVVNAADASVRACYDAALQESPNLRGDVLFQLVIGASGAVDTARLTKRLGVAAFDDCALAVMRGLRFPAPYKGKPVTLNQPMRFAPPQGDRRVGRLNFAQISAAFTIAQADFRACYDRRVALKPTLAGSIALALSVSAEGAVQSASIVENGPGDPTLGDCILQRARLLRFARPAEDAPAEVTYRLSFSPPAR